MSSTAVSIVTALFFLLIVLSGLWLSRKGRPLSVGISTIHKLSSLGAGVFLLVAIFRRNPAVALGAAEWAGIVSTGLCFLAMVATGGFLSTERPLPAAFLRIHQIVPALTALATGTTLYLVLVPKP